MKPRLLLLAICALVLACLAIAPAQSGPGPAGSPWSTPPTTRTSHATGVVTRVSDGDTIKVLLAGETEDQYVRLIGIDTPEVFGEKECWGHQASRAMKARLPVGTSVKLTRDPTQDNKDQYGRLLRYVSKAGTDLNRKQVKTGNARLYLTYPHAFLRTRAYRAAQTYAKSHDRGLWKACR